MRRVWIAAAALAAVSCVSEKEREAVGPVARIERLLPEKVMAGRAFQPQPNGESALSVIGANLQRGSRVRLNGQPLETAYGDGTSMAALVPKHLYARAATYAVTVDQPDGRISNSLAFVVLPESGPAPRIDKLYPDMTAAGKGFNVQPKGESALGLTGANFLPGATISFAGVELANTVFGDIDKLSAVVPPKLFEKPGVVKVVVKNIDGKVSEPADFRISRSQ